MLSFGQIYQKLEQYDKDNYYVRDSEVETRFIAGSGWQELGVSEKYEITSEDFTNLAEGRNLNGNYLSKEFEQKDHRQGFDFVWSPHKSVTLYAFTSKENLKLVTESMNLATKSLIDFIEREGYIQYRETLDGETISKSSDNATVLVNTHLCGRLDPQVHNHISIFNFTRTENGEYKAINSDALYANKYVFEAYLENQLAYQLKQHGISTEFVREGNSKEYVTKIAGLSEEHWKGIARTSELIDRYLEQHREELLQKYPNSSESQLREIAYLEIRQSKQSKTVEELFQQVENALKEQGFSKEDIVNIVSQYKLEQEQGIEQKSKEEIAKEIVNKAIDEIIDRQSTFSHSDIYKAAFQISAGRVDSDTLVQTVKENKRLIEMGYVQDKQHRLATTTYQDKFYTTQEVIAWEHNILKSVEEGKNSVEKITEKEYVNEKLTTSQLKAINHILQSQDRYTAIVGWAGVGKTTFVGEMSKELGKINELAKESGYRLIGISNTNTAVNELKEVGIEAMTTAKFLNTAKALQNLDSKTILIVDEASFLSTKDMSTIIDKTRESGARIVFIGDDRQLPGVQAGSPFAALVRENKISYVKMTDIVRQRNEELKSAIYDIYSKDIEKALSHLEFRQIERDSALEIAYNMLSKEHTPRSWEVFSEVKAWFEGQKNNSVVGVDYSIVDPDSEKHHKIVADKIVVEPKFMPFEREILKKLEIQDEGVREAFFSFKDLNLNDESRIAVNDMIRIGWIIPIKLELNGKTYGAYQKTGFFGIAPEKIKEAYGEKYQEYIQKIEEQKKEIYREIAAHYFFYGYKDSAISTANNEDMRLLNQVIHEELLQSTQNPEFQNSFSDQILPNPENIKIKEINVWINKNLDPIVRLRAQSYNIGDKLIVMGSGAGIKVGQEIFVKEVDVLKNTIKVEYVNKKGEIKEKVLNVEKIGDKVQAFQKETIQLAEGEKIIFNNTYKDKNFANSEFAFVKSINDDGSITVTSKLNSDKAKTTTFTKEELEKGVHFQYGYAVTADRMQGKTTQNVISFETRNYENFLVSVTRAKQNATIYSTLSKEKFIEKASEEATKERIERMAYKFNKDVFESVREQIYENLQQKEKEQQQEREDFQRKERDLIKQESYKNNTEIFDRGWNFISDLIEQKNIQNSHKYSEWSKQFSKKDFENVQKAQRPSTVRRIARALVDPKYVDQKFRDWLDGKSRDRWEKFSLKDQIKTWWKNNLNRDLEKLGFQKRRDYYKTYEVYLKDKNGQWHKGIQKLHVKVRGKKTTIEGYTLTKDGIYHFTIEKQKGLFGIEKVLDKTMEFVPHLPSQHISVSLTNPPKTVTKESEHGKSIKEVAKEVLQKQEQQKFSQKTEVSPQIQSTRIEPEPTSQTRVNQEEQNTQNMMQVIREFVLQKINESGKVTSKEVLEFASKNGIPKELAIATTKEMQEKGLIYAEKYDEKTKTLTFISASKLSEQHRAVSQSVTNIYRNTSKWSFTLKDIKAELKKMNIEVSDKTIKKHLTKEGLKLNGKGKYEFSKDSMLARQDKEIIALFTESLKDKGYFTVQEFHKAMAQLHHIHPKRLERFLYDSKDIKLIGYQKDSSGQLQTVFAHKSSFENAKQAWLNNTVSVSQKADENIVKLYMQKEGISPWQKLNESQIEKLQKESGIKNRGYAISLTERVQHQMRESEVNKVTQTIRSLAEKNQGSHISKTQIKNELKSHGENVHNKAISEGINRSLKDGIISEHKLTIRDRETKTTKEVTVYKPSISEKSQSENLEVSSSRSQENTSSVSIGRGR